MPFRSAPRLKSFDYVGLYRYSLTICTHERQHVFTDSEAVETILSQLRQSSAAHRFAVIAYCFMTDHLHLLVEGPADDSDLKNFVRVFKQQTSFVWLQKHEEQLWQRGYFDHVLREEEATVTVARYLLDNPVRAGIVSAPDQYRFLGSMTMSLSELLDSSTRY